MTASPSTTQATHMMQQQQFNTTNANSSSSSSQDQNITNTNNTNTTSATTILPNYNSPQSSLIIQQPSSVGVTSMQQTAIQHRGPMSVPSAIYQQHPHDGGMTNVQLMSSNEADKAATEEPLYSQKLEQLKAYQDQIRRIIERNRLDGQQPKQKYERLIEIMEGRRKVDLNLMEKLIVSVKCTVERSSVCYPLLEIARIDSNSLLSDTLKSSLPDPWIDFRQYSIKVPDEVIAITNENINKQSPQKRNASFGGVASKRIKKEDGLPVSVSVDEKKVIGASEKRILVDCSDGSKIELSNEVCGELRNARFRFDTDLLPISSESTEVHVLIENDSLLVPPLRLVIPVKYPEVGASIWRDQWSFGSDLDSEVNVHFEKRLAMTNNSSSVAEIINAWRIACEHAIRVS
ncbi:unnamed protein product [Anisakis simplex]|uniref:Mediator complex subunit 15 n=1 Tax=Anisakis simplex TaxID=6269 RepID=A0A0M3JTV7_ANISI|nr:unnamed protein product [Anisakis simplex]